MTDPRTELVGRAYDAIGEHFAERRDRIVGDPRREWEDELVRGSRTGRACSNSAAVRVYRRHGASPHASANRRRRLEEQVRRARAAVPGAEFVRGDFTALELESESFDAVVSFYAFNHVPRELLAPTFARIRGWLVPSGLLMTALGTSDTEGWAGDWLGAPTFFSSFPPETNRGSCRGLLRDPPRRARYGQLPEGDVTYQGLAVGRLSARQCPCPRALGM